MRPRFPTSIGGAMALVALDALVAAGASIEPIRREYPETPAPARDRTAEGSRYMPHTGKKQIAKALRRAAKGVKP